MKNAFILCHTTGKAAGLSNIRSYAEDKGFLVYELLHPLEDYSKIGTTYVRPDATFKYARKNIGLFNYFEDFIRSVKVIKSTKIHVFFGCSNFDTMPALFCKIILRQKIHKIIYYPRDYSIDRFDSSVMNGLYKIVERLAVKHSDITISNTMRAQKARVELGLNSERAIVIPNPVTLRKPLFKSKRISKDAFIYVGDVSKEHGLYELIETLGRGIKKLVIIGGGKDWNRTVQLARKKEITLELHKNKSHDFVIDYLRDFEGIGLAPYNNDSNWTYYCSPLKVSEYISCGVPVLMSEVPECAYDMSNDGLGVTYGKLDASIIMDKLSNLDLSGYHLKAEAFYRKNNTSTLYSLMPLQSSD